MTHVIRQMGHVTFSTPDPEGSAQDLVDLVGLKITDRRDGAVYLSSNARHFEVAFMHGDERGVLAVGIEAMDAAAVAEVRRRVLSDGLELLGEEPLGPGIDRAVRFKTPFGFVIEVHTAIARDQAHRHIGPGAQPRRIEHANFKAPDTRLLHDVFTKVLGLKLSDRTAGDEFNWFRANDGYHHTMAVFRGDPALHHYAFDFHALQDLAGIADGLVVKGRHLLWGPGRHGAGGNVFQYYVDPNNCVVEMSVGMDRIENDAMYEARTWEFTSTMSDAWINLWGSPPPSDFTVPGLVFLANHP